MFNSPSIPADKILTRYIAPYGLTALLPPHRAGEPVESFWLGGHGVSGIALFLSALDAEIYRLQLQSMGEHWVRSPLETIAFQYTVEVLGEAWANLSFCFSANHLRQLNASPDGYLSIPSFMQRFTTLDYPPGPVTFEFHRRAFDAIETQWARIAAAAYAGTVSKLNRLGASPAGAPELQAHAKRALALVQVAPRPAPTNTLAQWALFSPDSDAWRFGPHMKHQHLH
jgi:hypothetical protein